MMKKIVLLVLCVSCRNGTATPQPAGGQAPASISVSSPAFGEGAAIPPNSTCQGSDQSPELTWSAVPSTARSVAIVVDDPDAPGGTFTHWIVWNIKPETRVLGGAANGGLGGGTAGTNDFGRVGYGGPCPPKGKVHHYRFTVYGLDTLLTLKASDKRADLDAAMNHHIVAQGTLTGTFQS